MYVNRVISGLIQAPRLQPLTLSWKPLCPNWVLLLVRPYKLELGLAQSVLLLFYFNCYDFCNNEQHICLTIGRKAVKSQPALTICYHSSCKSTRKEWLNGGIQVSISIYHAKSSFSAMNTCSLSLPYVQCSCWSRIFHIWQQGVQSWRKWDWCGGDCRL